jgi:hypothetical protein
MLIVTNPLNSSELIFPTLECIHILGFALSVGTIAILDFRLLGMGMRRQAVSALGKDLAPWTLFGLAVMLISGPLLFSSDPDMYYLNYAFNTKMVVLLLAIIFNYTAHRKAVAADASGGRAKLIAIVSLVLWVGVVTGGIFIGFV